MLTNPNDKTLQTAYLSQIWIYPVKSLAGTRVPAAHAGWSGLQHDRQWMVTDAGGRALTQRDIPGMALLRASVTANGLEMASIHEMGDKVIVPFSTRIGQQMQVKVWNDRVDAHCPSQIANQWLSERLGQEVKLVAMHPDISTRTYDVPRHPSGALSFADDFPYHLIGQSSVDDLNARLDEEVTIQRFRPNFVIAGLPPYGDDLLGTFTIGEAAFASISPCERCVMVNIEPGSAKKGRQPLKTLSNYRRQGNNITFGQNLIAIREGLVREMDQILMH